MWSSLQRGRSNCQEIRRPPFGLILLGLRKYLMKRKALWSRFKADVFSSVFLFSLYEIKGGRTQRGSLLISFTTAACLYHSTEMEELKEAASTDRFPDTSQPLTTQ